MSIKTINKSRTNNERQARRREREKQWLAENGWRSWEALHTALMNGVVFLNPRRVDLSRKLQISHSKTSK